MSDSPLYMKYHQADMHGTLGSFALES